MEKQQYQIEYHQFLDDYQSGITDGSKVGELISRLGSYYTNANLEYASSLIAFNIKARSIEETVDEVSGKMISSSKASVLTAGTIESQNLIIAKTHINNIETIINCAKSLQRGLMNERGFSNL